METTYDFLELLELDEGALERDIRRAYARKLKRIDQEADPDGFQALRTAYEVALDWARWKLAQEPQEPPPEEPPAPAAPAAAQAALQDEAPVQEEEPPEAVRLGGEVFGRLGESAKALEAAGKLGDVDAWRAAIEARFADEELVNIDARIYFEAYVASMLANGWRPGHEALFVAAKDAFAWDGDRRRLWQLGQAGRMLDQAIEERHVFDALPAEEQVRMRELARMLRQPDLPATRRLQAAMPDTERMLARFPTLMAVVTDMENVERWRSAYWASGGAPIAFDVQDTVPAPAEPKRSFSNWQGILIFLVLSAVLRALFNYAGGEGQDVGGPLPPNLQQAPQQAVPQDVLDQVVPPIRYTPAPGSKTGELEVVYKVFLNFDNKVERVQNAATSGDPGFDDAVGTALRNAKPFPAGTPREFSVRFSTKLVRDPRLPKAGGARTLMPEQAIPEATLRAHLPPIRFVPSPGMKEGRYSGTYRVSLDEGGKVVGVRTIQPSGDARLDRTINLALWAAKPFPGGFRSFDFSYATEIVRKPAASDNPSDAGQQAAGPVATPPETTIED